MRLPLRRVTILTGGNGVGKTNIYRSLELLHAAARGTIADEIAREGGLGSVFWAGGKNLSPDGAFDPRYRTDGLRKGEANRLALEATLEDFGTYRIEFGFPQKITAAAFDTEAQIKLESLRIIDRGRPRAILERNGRHISLRHEDADDLLASETALAELGGADADLGAVRTELSNWRFYHGFRTDPDSALRRPCRAITSPLLASDGSNLAAVFATLRHIRQDTVDLDAAIEAAFPGAELRVPRPDETATFEMVFPETPKRGFRPHELSEGTLQFLALMGALLSYRLPPFIALNEPEASLHPSLLPALAAAISKAAERAQLCVVTHSELLASAIADVTGAVPREVRRDDDGTAIKSLSPLGVFEEDE
ncbi:MAG: ATPase [Hyphomicrobiales bacterium]|nr:MAG: ATPase [Hyphomicrobiales bacterium]